MRLTDFSDYALRLLMYAGARGDRLVTIEETANLYGISRAHLMKVANQLTRAGFLRAVRGRSGGLGAKCVLSLWQAHRALSARARQLTPQACER